MAVTGKRGRTPADDAARTEPIAVDDGPVDPRLLEAPPESPKRDSLLDDERVREAAGGIRRRVLVHTIRHGGGYLSQACSAAEILSTLYLRLMNLGPSAAPLEPGPFPGVPGDQNGDGWGGLWNGPDDPENDRFVLSPAHYALVLYATLIEAGRLAEGALEQFNRDGSRLEMIGAEHSPGVEVTSGSLAQALSVAAGRALGRQRRQARGRIWVLASDGEFQEGQTWEMLAFANHWRLDNLVVYVDANGSQCDGPVDAVMMLEPLAAKVRAFGWRVAEVDGHDVDALAAPAEAEPDGRPVMVIARTQPWEGIPALKERTPKFHYVRFADADEEERALADLGLSRAEVGV
jgi:transketolase